jgi:hypothetical protein
LLKLLHLPQRLFFSNIRFVPELNRSGGGGVLHVVSMLGPLLLMCEPAEGALWENRTISPCSLAASAKQLKLETPMASSE